MSQRLAMRLILFGTVIFMTSFTNGVGWNPYVQLRAETNSWEALKIEGPQQSR